MKGLKISASLVLIFVLSVNIIGQEKFGTAGKVFTKAEADELYGPVLKSVTVDLATVKSALAKVSDYILFTIKNDKPVIADKTRNVVFTTSAESLTSDEVLHMYSVSVFNELLEKGKSNSIILEQRGEVFSVTSGDYTMEVAFPCPPICE